MHHWFVESGPLMSVGLVALLVPRIAPFDRAGIVLLGGIIGVHALGVLLQAKFFAYHWGATWPLAALLAARGFWKVRAVAVSRGSRQAGLFYAGLGALCLLSIIRRRGLADRLVLESTRQPHHGGAQGVHGGSVVAMGKVRHVL